MRICYLSKRQGIASHSPSKTLKNYSEYHQFFILFSSKNLKPISASQALKSRDISPESDSLPIQASRLLFQTSSSKRFRKKT